MGPTTLQGPPTKAGVKVPHHRTLGSVPQDPTAWFGNAPGRFGRGTSSPNRGPRGRLALRLTDFRVDRLPVQRAVVRRRTAASISLLQHRVLPTCAPHRNSNLRPGDSADCFRSLRPGGPGAQRRNAQRAVGMRHVACFPRRQARRSPSYLPRVGDRFPEIGT
ncbi:hypothetical protein M011DRAFT_462894 [Sporormia fimetaria CBS 119925]|uniref:Uncharacterized protein n=1 Tax=Sporormia fimetaria CBS 119925 TaxID=1340428 RepID=A0A6A6UWP6_9PLEO|nr:hypothetical protein M011DRAFT_462894 [Sporormia fimetaria CBS 119925]